jgi:hypothetical protein
MPPTKRPTSSTKSTDQSLVYAYEKAFHDIGRKPGKVMEWLIRFGEKDLRTISKKEWDQLQNELKAFIDIGRIELSGRNLHQALVLLKNSQAYRIQHGPLFLDPITLPMAKKLQSITKTAIKELIEEGMTYLPKITTSALIGKRPKPRFGSHIKGLYFFSMCQGGQTGMHDEFIVHLQNLLKEVGLQLEICHSPTCRKTFVMYRYDQRYCTKRCRSRVAMKEWRQKRKNEKSKPKGGAKRGTKRQQ